MTGLVVACSIAAGTMLLSSYNCFGRRATGAALLGWGLLMTSPARADQTIAAEDNGSVHCDASKDDLTRISLQDDQFSAVSKIAFGTAGKDFSVVHEPNRGDIYISVPENYARDTVSFFGTTRKGFVYKFVCKVAGADAKQVFVTNAHTAQPEKPQTLALEPEVPLDEQALSLLRAMFQQKPAEGYEIRDRPRAAVTVGTLKVQLVSEYRGALLAGNVLRIENVGAAPAVIGEDLIAARGAIAISVSSATLLPGQATGAYVVTPSGDW
jgi:conjugal transfer pilus assembly protein TraK